MTDYMLILAIQVISTVVVSRLKAGLYKRLIMRMKAD
jgi:hypothetical protein